MLVASVRDGAEAISVFPVAADRDSFIASQLEDTSAQSFA
jgi:hypothetical protein